MTQPLNRQFNVAVLHIADKLFPRGFAVSAIAPSTFEELNTAFIWAERGGQYPVWSGGSEATIFGDREVNYAFRAWHDWTHWRGQHAFTWEGEIATARDQIGHIRALYGHGKVADDMCALIWAEVVGQLHHQSLHGEFPVDQRAFVVDYLANPYHATTVRYLSKSPY